MDPTNKATTAMGEEVTPLSYATPSTAGGSPVAAGFWIIFAGLSLVFFGGCFCIGILMLVTGDFSTGSTRPPLSWDQCLLMFILYACAIACLIAGAYVLYLGLRKLLMVGRI